MFDQLFTHPQARQRHVNSPLLQERLDYLRHCAEQGYKLGTLQERAANLLRIQNLLGLAASSNTIDPAAIEAAVKPCFRRRSRHSNYKNGCRRKQILSVAIHWLRFLKRLRLPSVALPDARALWTLPWCLTERMRFGTPVLPICWSKGSH